MGTNCALLVADLFLFCYEWDFMLSVSRDKDGEDIEAFNSTSRYLDYLLNIDKYTEKRSFGNKESNICKQQTILRYGQTHLAVRTSAK